MNHSSELTVYRVRQSKDHPKRSVRNAWYARTWQAEGPDQVWAPRAYTERGVRRKWERWDRRGFEWRIRHARRWQWVRMHITQRNDEFYSRLRAARKEGA